MNTLMLLYTLISHVTGRKKALCMLISHMIYLKQQPLQSPIKLEENNDIIEHQQSQPWEPVQQAEPDKPAQPAEPAEP